MASSLGDPKTQRYFAEVFIKAARQKMREEGKSEKEIYDAFDSPRARRLMNLFSGLRAKIHRDGSR